MSDPFGVPRRALILGATSGISTNLALALARRGTSELLLAARAPEALDGLVAELAGLGTLATPLAFDATATGSHAAFAADAWRRHGPIDLVVLAFGVLGDARGGEAPDAQEVIAVNYAGAVSALEAVTPHLRDQGAGAIVVLSSVAAERPRASNHLYASTKAGLDAYARGLGDALAPQGVHVLVVRPGFVRTRMTRHLDDGPLAVDPPAVSTAILRGLDRRAAVVWAPPAARVVMSALRHLPAGGYRWVSRGR